MLKKIRKILMSFMLAFLTLFSCFSGVVMAHAEVGVEGGYTSVLEDLKKDEKFNEGDYPIKEKDYKLEVISISESVDGELFVYVYQPHPEHGKYVASSINISATDDDSLKINNYPLTLVSVDGVFQKYMVVGVTLPTSETRYYDVISIYRVFDETIDEGLDDDNDNTINEVVFKVGKGFILTDTADGLVVNQKDLDVITVTEKYVGFMRLEKNKFPTSPVVYSDSYDVHFVAFSTDKQIDDLLEADVYYTSQSANGKLTTSDWDMEYGEPKPERAFLKKEDHETLSGTPGWFSNEYQYNAIESASAFMETEYVNYAYDMGAFNVKETVRLTDECKNNIKNCDWVLRFAVTTYSFYEVSGLIPSYRCSYDIVGDVSILRLKFETDGVIYNLGVIDNKQSGDLIPDNVTKTELELSDVFKIILALLGLILLLQVLNPILPIVFSLIGGIFKIITFPFRVIFGKKRRK